jgi:RecA/RadA recombinase
MTPLAEAAAFLAQEWPVFPCDAQKRPITPRGFYDATTHPGAVKAMFAEPGAVLIGVPMGAASKLLCLDIDAGHGGLDWLHANQQRIPQTRTHKTMNGGQHLFFRWPKGRNLRNRASKWARGVDIRGEGGYAIMPPSPGYDILDPSMPADAPAWLLDLIDPPAAPPAPPAPYQPPSLDRATRYAEAALDAECRAVASAGEGGRNHQLNVSAVKLGGLVAAGALSESVVRLELRRAALHAGLEPRETDLTIQSGLSFGMQQPRQIPERVAYQAATTHVPPSAPASGSGEPIRAEDDSAPKHLPLVYLDDIEPCLDAKDFVEGVLVEQSAAVIYGESNAGKTFLATDLALSVAAGQQWFGKAVDKGGVVYCVLEGGVGFRNRIRAWLDFNAQPNTIPFATIPASINLLDPTADTPRLIDAIAEAKERLGVPIKLVVIDTLARAFAGGNENSSEDMGQLVLNMDLIRQKTGAAVLFIHHSGKDQAKGARGHSSLRAAIDTEIEVKAPEDTEAPRTAIVVKQRELPKGDTFSFGLKVIELGQNRRKKAVTTCVVTPSDKPADTGPKLSDGTKKALSALDEVSGQNGQAPMSGDIPKWARVVKLSDWRREFLRRSGEATESAAERAFSRARKYLEDAEKIGIRDGWVWRTDANKPL